ncbi:MAG TPA: DUF357 domain-containing protein [Candidatus Pacearchaeota archaeon]|nr:DUF357 domain-containing protein [Candidatus Pacearchaeota archaeon]
MLTEKSSKELIFMLQREDKKLKEVFKSIKLTGKEKAKEIFELAKSYYKDYVYFKEKKDYVKAFELQNYVWGLLDALAILKAISVPKKLQKYFKTDF